MQLTGIINGDISSKISQGVKCNYLLIFPACASKGNLTSLHLEEESRKLLATYRPTTKHPSVRHVVSALQYHSGQYITARLANICVSQPLLEPFLTGQRKQMCFCHDQLQPCKPGQRLRTIALVYWTLATAILQCRPPDSIGAGC